MTGRICELETSDERISAIENDSDPESKSFAKVPEECRQSSIYHYHSAPPKNSDMHIYVPAQVRSPPTLASGGPRGASDPDLPTLLSWSLLRSSLLALSARCSSVVHPWP